MPKIELHRHLEGSIRLPTLIECLPKGSPLKNLQVLTPQKNLTQVLECFKSVQTCFRSQEIIERIAFECLEDAYNENITHLEIRFSPSYMTGHISGQNPNLSFTHILQSIIKGLKRGAHWPIKWGLICTFQRTLPSQDNQKVLRFFLENLDSFVGADLADDEVVANSKTFQWIFKEISKYSKGITIHAGEALTENQSLASAQNVLSAVQDLGALRIGHGVQIKDHPTILNFVKEKGVCLELCPTSNWLTQAIPEIKNHPIKKFLDLGLNVTLNSDDPALFGIDLTHEFQICSQILGFTPTDFEKVYENASRSTFIGKFSSTL